MEKLSALCSCNIHTLVHRPYQQFVMASAKQQAQLYMPSLLTAIFTWYVEGKGLTKPMIYTILYYSSWSSVPSQSTAWVRG